MTEGYVILAQNTTLTNYVECAEALALSMKVANPSSNITLISDDTSDCVAFDHVVKLPYGDLAVDSEWKLVNDWQVFDASPYDYTIKLEADMYIPVNMDYFFTQFMNVNVSVCNTIVDYKGNESQVKAYRQFTTSNNLPDVYNAITYFDKSEFSKEFFQIVRDVFENWDNYKQIFMCDNDEKVTTDWAYSIACHLMGVEKTTHTNGFKMAHMKQLINDTITDDWTNELVYEYGYPLRIQSISQFVPVHYHIKDFAKGLKEFYGRV